MSNSLDSISLNEEEENFRVHDIIKLQLIRIVKTKMFILKKEKIENKDWDHRYP